MTNKDNAEVKLDKILTKLENAVWHDAVMTQAGQHGRRKSPKLIHSQTKTALTQLISDSYNKGKVAELENISELWSQHPALDFKYVPLPDIQYRLTTLKRTITNE